MISDRDASGFFFGFFSHWSHLESLRTLPVIFYIITAHMLYRAVIRLYIKAGDKVLFSSEKC